MSLFFQGHLLYAHIDNGDGVHKIHWSIPMCLMVLRTIGTACQWVEPQSSLIMLSKLLDCALQPVLLCEAIGLL